MFFPYFSPQSGHLPIHTHQPTLLYHTTTTTWGGWRLTPRHVKPANCVIPNCCSCCVTHSEESTIYTLPHTWAQIPLGLVSLTMIDRGKWVCLPSHPENMVSFDHGCGIVGIWKLFCRFPQESNVHYWWEFGLFSVSQIIFNELTNKSRLFRLSNDSGLN